MASGRLLHQDSEYIRNGTASVFIQPRFWAGVTAEVTERRPCQDFATVIKAPVDEQFARAEKRVLVMNNLNTHGPTSLYATFLPAEAGRYVRNKLHD